VYINVRFKFYIALLCSLGWFFICAYLSLSWMHDLSNYVGLFPSFLIILFIALIPGLMQMFLFISYLLDKRPTAKSVDNNVPVTILIAAYNEEDCIGKTLVSISKQNYSGIVQVIVIDDGSTDETINIVESFSLPNLLLIKNSHGGKANALNTGLARSDHSLIIGLDADTQLRSSAIKDLVDRLLSDPPGTVAVAGSLFVSNSRINMMTRMQEFDYFQSITAIKRVQSLFQGTLVAQGAFSIYRKEALIEIGGWPSTVGEDIVISWGLLARKYRIGFSEKAVAFTSVPTTYKTFFYQRSRWARGMLEAFRLNPSILVTPRLTLFFIYWNFFFPFLDITFVFIFIPGIILAFFGKFYLAGPYTLAVIPIALIYNAVFFHTQRKIFHNLKLSIRHNISGFVMYVLFYQFIMAPACIHGYLSEILNLKKKWGTKK
jgi:biofilm PGA synthesis N-glycosyltransferase PgaC